MGNVVLFTGHMLDRPDRTTPRFRPSDESFVRQRIESELSRLDAETGFASGACGGDILFHECLLDRGGDINLVFPCALDEFMASFVNIVPGADWRKRLERLIERASTVEILGRQSSADNSVASECCNRVLVGLALRASTQLGKRPKVLAVWDGRPGDQGGGTQTMVSFCLTRGLSVTRIDPRSNSNTPQNESELLGPKLTDLESPATISSSTGAPHQHLCAMLFCDVVGFSELSERQLPAFAREYLGGAARLLLDKNCSPLAQNSWGDGLHFVFDDISAAGHYALSLRDFVASADWARHGLPSDMSVRIAIHAGPAYSVHDPILGRQSFVGEHVTEAARMEPICQAGEVIVSRVYAALIEAIGIEDLTCEDLGMRDLAKGHGRAQLFRLNRPECAGHSSP